jgi:hypothetical protein
MVHQLLDYLPVDAVKRLLEDNEDAAQGGLPLQGLSPGPCVRKNAPVGIS